MILPDANVLQYAVNAAAQQHAATLLSQHGAFALLTSRAPCPESARILDSASAPLKFIGSFSKHPGAHHVAGWAVVAGQQGPVEAVLGAGGAAAADVGGRAPDHLGVVAGCHV